MSRRAAALAPLLLAACQSAGSEPPPVTPTSWLGRQYELDPGPDGKKGDLFRLVPHRDTYVAWNYTTDPNQASSADPAEEVRANELDYQFSLKTKAWQGVFDDRIDLWLGYTQTGHNQILQQSVPFRSTDYEPELFFTGRVDVEVGPLRWRTASLGFNHGSNGEAGPQSRTWNRVIAEFGFERGGFDLVVRPWWRVREPDSIDDNPDISKFMGPGDLTLRFERSGFIAALMLRNNCNLAENRGACQLSLFAPTGLSERFKFFARAFYGYGDSLIDYDHRQATFSIGFAFTDWN